MRTGTVAVEVGVDGLAHLDKICVGFDRFFTREIGDAYDAIETEVVCTQSSGRRELLDKVTENLDYDKPVLITVTTKFRDFHTAPRQFGFVDFLENLIVSDRALLTLPEYIQLAVGGTTDLGGVFVTLSRARQRPLLIVTFGNEAPSASPTFSNTAGSNNLPPSGARELGFNLPLVAFVVLGVVITTM